MAIEAPPTLRRVVRLERTVSEAYNLLDSNQEIDSAKIGGLNLQEALQQRAYAETYMEHTGYELRMLAEFPRGNIMCTSDVTDLNLDRLHSEEGITYTIEISRK